jgi:hypothetical protein
VTRLQDHLLAGVILGLLGVAAVVALTVGLRRTIKAADLEPERPPAPDRRQPVAG